MNLKLYDQGIVINHKYDDLKALKEENESLKKKIKKLDKYIDKQDNYICELEMSQSDEDKFYNAFEIIEAVEKWSREHQKQKYKVSQLEYDILKYFNNFSNSSFTGYFFLETLMKKGYFKGADKEMKIRDYLQNCEVVEDD